MLDMFRRPMDPSEYPWLYAVPGALFGAGFIGAAATGMGGLVQAGYLASSLLCIGGISGLASQATARQGNLLGILGVGSGVLLAVADEGDIRMEWPAGTRGIVVGHSDADADRIISVLREDGRIRSFARSALHHCEWDELRVRDEVPAPVVVERTDEDVLVALAEDLERVEKKHDVSFIEGVPDKLRVLADQLAKQKAEDAADARRAWLASEERKAKLHEDMCKRVALAMAEPESLDVGRMERVIEALK
ncbi:MAG: hypothetical protein M1823_006807 [Watsoniomyces obsoletus]|nr:MAG: hypothetical protein M1823_006807 [Watsoniomyces obsoletus]